MDDQARLGRLVPDFTPPPRPNAVTLKGRFVRLERMDPDTHAGDLHRACCGHANDLINRPTL